MRHRPSRLIVRRSWQPPSQRRAWDSADAAVQPGHFQVAALKPWLTGVQGVGLAGGCEDLMRALSKSSAKKGDIPQGTLQLKHCRWQKHLPRQRAWSRPQAAGLKMEEKMNQPINHDKWMNEWMNEWAWMHSYMYERNAPCGPLLYWGHCRPLYDPEGDAPWCTHFLECAHSMCSWGNVFLIVSLDQCVGNIFRSGHFRSKPSQPGVAQAIRTNKKGLSSRSGFHSFNMISIWIHNLLSAASGVPIDWT